MPNRSVASVRETAERLGLSLTTTYVLVRSGQIPATRVGGKYLVPLTWLESIEQRQPVEAALAQ